MFNNRVILITGGDGSFGENMYRFYNINVLSLER